MCAATELLAICGEEVMPPTPKSGRAASPISHSTPTVPSSINHAEWVSLHNNYSANLA